MPSENFSSCEFRSEFFMSSVNSANFVFVAFRSSSNSFENFLPLLPR